MFEIIYRYDPDHPRDRNLPGDASEARRRLEEGNKSFASLGTGQVATPRIVQLDLEDIGMAGAGGVPVQEPFAVVLGCSDARVPIEMIFDCACNELFVVRVAGNIIGQEQLGSLDYAVENLGQNLKLIVALGHSQCGAVSEPVRDVAFYLDSGWPGDNYEVTMAMAMALVSRGWRYGLNLMHLCFPQAEHNEMAWGLRLHLPLQFLNGAVARASRAGAPVLGDTA